MTTSSIDMGTETKSKSRLAFFMFVVLLLSYVVNAMDRQLFSVLASDVRKALDLSLPQVGLASTVFTLGMGLAGIPTGYLLSKLSRKSVVIIGLVMFSVATYMTGYASNLTDLMIYRFISGLGEAMQLTAILAIGTTYFLNHRAVAASSLNFTFGIGAIIGPNLGASILANSDWQVPFVAFGLAGIPVLLLIMIFVKPWFSELVVSEKNNTVESDVGGQLWSITPILMAIATVFAGLAIYGYLGLYPTFLRESLGFTPKQAGLAVSFYGAGALLSLFGGWLGDKFNYRKILIISLVVAAVTGGILFSGTYQSIEMNMFLSFIFGSSISGMVYANLSAGIIKSVKRSLASKASGLFVASLYIPAAFSGYLLGALKGILGWTGAGLVQVSLCALISACLVALSSKFSTSNN
jgi:MFS family permease